MTESLPSWAMQAAAPPDRERVARAVQGDRAVFAWPDDRALRAWARQHGWPAPAFGLRKAFVAKMLESDEDFALALRESGVTIAIPAAAYTLPPQDLARFDALYAARAPGGRPSAWGTLVEGLRGIRRAVEAGVAVEIEGSTIRDFGAFYTWAHARYHMLEDGYDRWIGDDR
jgi:hypothetical protein